MTMTVTQLREALQKLEAEGHGDLPVYYEDAEYGNTAVDQVKLFTPTHHDRVLLQ